MPWNDDDSIKCDRCDRVFVPPVNLDRNRTVIAAGIAGWDIDGLEFGCPEHPNQDPLEEAEAKIKRLREWLEKERDAEVTTGYGLGYQNCALHALRVLDDAEAPSPMDGVWRCQDCGEMVEPMSPKWRMARDRWQHHHDYPIGHVDATYFGAPLDAEPQPPVGEPDASVQPPATAETK